jgi:hypothetical protein
MEAFLRVMKEVIVPLCVCHTIFTISDQASSDRATSEGSALTSATCLASYADGEQRSVEVDTRDDDDEQQEERIRRRW